MPIPNTWRSTIDTLAQGLRGAAFRDIRAASIDASFTQLVGLIALGLAVQFTHDFVTVGPHGQLALYELPSVLFKLPVILVAAWAACRLAGRSDAILAMTVLVAAIALPVAVLEAVLGWGFDSRLVRRLWQGSDWFYFLRGIIGPAWLAAAGAAACWRLLGPLQGRRRLAISAMFLLVWLPLWQVGSWGVLWTQPYDEESFAQDQLRRNPLAGEQAFYVQQGLLDKATSSLAASPSDRVAVYFVGVAGDAGQDVFMKEVHYVSNLFKARFDTAGRSVMLINNPSTVLDTPIASVTSLGLTLKQVGKAMNPDKDILFLYLTSHGSEDHRLTLDLGAMRFNTLDPPALRRLLDEAGIKHRVVVVSACYSGGFIEPLKSPDTLVITASAKDRKSHGCSNEADFTFFGKAYFEDGLGKTDSFIEAFDLAKPLITSRELKDDYDPADPQMFVGPVVRAAIDRFVEQRKAGPGARHGNSL